MDSKFEELNNLLLNNKNDVKNLIEEMNKLSFLDYCLVWCLISKYYFYCHENNIFNWAENILIVDNEQDISQRFHDVIYDSTNYVEENKIAIEYLEDRTKQNDDYSIFKKIENWFNHHISPVDKK